MVHNVIKRFGNKKLIWENSNKSKKTFLSLYNFIFCCRNYIQIKVCAMGTICVSTYANIFMDHSERKYLSLLLQGLSLTYLRFLINKFFIWTRSKEQFIQNLDKLNIKFKTWLNYNWVQNLKSQYFFSGHWSVYGPFHAKVPQN